MTRSLTVLVLLSLAACATDRDEMAKPHGSPPDRDALLSAAALELAETGSSRAEEFLGAAGRDAVPWLRRLLESEDPDVRRRARGLLLAAGEDIPMTPADEVDLILFDLTRSEPHPFASLRALERVRKLGPQGRDALRAVSGGKGPRAEMARRLLEHLAKP